MSGIPTALQQFETRMRAAIPMTRAMDLHLTEWDGGQLVLNAPLAPNVNDKGCAFGGSLASAMTIAGWAAVALTLAAQGKTCDIFVGRSTIHYLAPVWADFEAVAILAEGNTWQAFLTHLAERGKAGVEMSCVVRERGHATDAATLQARFVAKGTQAGPASGDKTGVDAAQ